MSAHRPKQHEHRRAELAHHAQQRGGTDRQALCNRRDFLRMSGAVCAAGLLGPGASLPRPLAKPHAGTHFEPRIRRVVWLMQTGGPSHVDLLDPKPELVRRAGQELPKEVRGSQRLTTMTAGQKGYPLLPAFRPFVPCGESGLEISSLLPFTGSIADKLCVVRSMYTEAVNHAPATTLCLTGHQIPGRPSIGAWLAHALGSIDDRLPGYVVLTSRDRENSCGQLLYDHYWSSGFLPSQHQGVKLHPQGEAVPYLGNPAGVSRRARRALLDDLAALNRMHMSRLGDPETAARIAQYELAFRMQESIPEILDLGSESDEIVEMYGPDVRRRGSFAQNCLIARRLLEGGSRFVQLMHAGWDQHNNIATQLETQCLDTDQPSAALVRDLEMRGLLEDTLVIWGGEFGRTPFKQGKPKSGRLGRDHHGNAFSLWLAGGGVKAGHVFGASDDFGYNPVDRSGNIIRPTKHSPHPDAVHIHDLQATILHLLGFDHERLTHLHQGRRYRLTDVHGHVVHDVLA